MKLGAKTTALLAAIVSLVLIIAGFFLLRYHEESLKQAIIKGVDGQAAMAVQGIEAFIEEGLSASHAISVTLPVKALLEGRFSAVQSHLNVMSGAFPLFKGGMFILDNQGNFLVDYPPHPELRRRSFAFREYYQRTIRENHGVVSKPYRSQRTGLPVLTFTAPIRNAEGRTLAVLACSVNLLSREALGGYQAAKFWKTGYLYIFDKSRLLVLHPDKTRLLTQVEEGKNAILEAAVRGFEGGGETVNSKGVPMLLSVRQIPRVDWIVGIQVPQEEAYAPVVVARKRIIAISGLTLFLAVVFGAVAIRRITGRLEQLERAALQLGTELDEAETKGASDLPHPALDSLKDIRTRDEIGLLASSFLRLATKLNQALGSLRRSAEDWQRTFDAVKEAVVILDRESRIVRMNRRAEDWFRTSLQKVQGQFCYSVLFGASAPPEHWPDVATLKEHQRVIWSDELNVLHGMHGIFEFTLTQVAGHGETAGAVLIINDITERAKSEKLIREMAFYDQLTGLPNRYLLQDRIQQAIEAASRGERKVGIMFIDLDRFKELNDLLGHDAGDGALRETAARILTCLRKNDTLSRIGGDEFVVVLQDVAESGETVRIAERIIAAQTLPMTIVGREVSVTMSIGIAFYPDDGKEAETLLKNADTAMYQAKARGPNEYHILSR